MFVEIIFFNMFDHLKILEFTDNPLINAFIKFAAFILLLFILEFIVNKIFRKLTRKTETDLDDVFIDIIHSPLLISIFLFGIFFLVQDLDPTAKFLNFLRKILMSFGLILWSVAGLRLTRLIIVKILFKLFRFSGLRSDAVPALTGLLKIIIVVVSIIVMLAVWGVDLAPLLTSASIMSAVVLFAARDTLSNFFAGFTIIVDQPYKIGDYVDLQTERGEVVEIGLRSTRIKTRDDILISIPNSIIANEKIINESAPIKQFRVRIPIGVSYNSDVDLVEKILIEIAVNNANVIEEPEPRVRFRTFGDSSLNFELLCWARDPSLRGLTIHEINKEIVKKFRENNIEIPYPQRDLHIITDRTKKD